MSLRLLPPLGGGSAVLPDLDPSPAGTYDSVSDVEVDAKGRIISLNPGNGGGGAAPLRLQVSFHPGGGSIGVWKLRPKISTYVTYDPYGGSNAADVDNVALVVAPTGGATVKVRLEYDVDYDCTVTVRKRAADGTTWSTMTTHSAPAAESELEFDVTLAADEALDLHVGRTGGGTLTFAYFHAYW